MALKQKKLDQHNLYIKWRWTTQEDWRDDGKNESEFEKNQMKMQQQNQPKRRIKTKVKQKSKIVKIIYRV